ncbi:TetR family transcriptional regulator [Isoptericola jiangsuensis]|uniref:TetR family transcriptional regulator n=1 Tax=Isoptericola jiangsuensis TaxID=548579 RepID=A0A2A9F270_9MICO|nr:helix-turn-helix domain-containing protein [Isoptericola jiangsuensis]PFG44509.1 TetR family transcriptional regulator [Isoptericola jiangsuensis]
MSTPVTPRARRTRDRIQAVALDLFERHGYGATTVEAIAGAAGVTPMTFFRHYPTKDAVVVTDPFDPLVAAAVGAQPADLPVLDRVRRGLLAALDAVDPDEDEVARRRVAVVAAEPALRAAVVASTAATEAAIVDRLVADGAPRLDATVATAACLAACTAALLAADPGTPLHATVARALDVLAVAP